VPEFLQGVLVEVPPIDEDSPSGNLCDFEKGIDDGRFPSPRSSNDADLLPSSDAATDFLEDLGKIFPVLRAQSVEGNLSFFKGVSDSFLFGAPFLAVLFVVLLRFDTHKGVYPLNRDELYLQLWHFLISLNSLLEKIEVYPIFL
jgi:hypothetical protein